MIAAAAFLPWLAAVKAAITAGGVTIASNALLNQIQRSLPEMLRLFKLGTPPDGAVAWLKDPPSPTAEDPEVHDEESLLIEVATTPGAANELAELQQTGLWGRTIEETAERVMCAGLRAIIKDYQEEN